MADVGYGPLWRIAGPQPQPPLYTLVGASSVIDDLDGGTPRWVGGVVVHPYPTGPALAIDSACTEGTERVKAEGGIVPAPEFGSMVVYLTETCSSYGIFGSGLSNAEAQQRFTQRAMSAFTAMESAAVEREFMLGEALGLNPHLADGNGNFPWGDTATSIRNGIALLENEIALSGRRGVIHMSPGLAAAITVHNFFYPDPRSGTLRTVNGTTVVPGYGYAAGSTPASHSAPTGAEEWAYATGPIEIRRSEPILMPGTLAEALDRETNTVTYMVERYYTVVWDTVVQSAVLIDRCSDACGSPSS